MRRTDEIRNELLRETAHVGGFENKVREARLRSRGGRADLSEIHGHEVSWR